MENGPNGPLADEQVPEHTNNGVVDPIMAKLPEGNIIINQQDKINSTEIAKVNGDSITDINNEENSFSSESDALVIDESITRKKKLERKKNNPKLKVNSEEGIENISGTVTHSNPYFNESLFELSQLHQNNQETTVLNENLENTLDKVTKKLKKKGKPKQKIREYAQYLGLQPSVQFKCPKCNRSGFESLSSLEDHVIQCNEQNVEIISKGNSYSGFKLTRKVFLCSACGTYYENWNLYIHMLEFHKRFICLYCLGMFSILEDLCQHIQSKHNLEPGYKNTLDEFFNVYNEPCYIACCECNKLFSEQDNFFYHHCINKNKCKKNTKQQITPENHVTGESEPLVESNTNIEEPINQNTMEISDNILENAPSLLVNENQDTAVMETNMNEVNCQDTKTIIENNTVYDSVKDSKEDLTENYEIVRNNDDSSNHSDSVMPVNELVINEADSENITSTQGKMNEDETRDGRFFPTLEETIEKQFSDEFQDTRKVPKLSLKLPKLESYDDADAEAEDSDDSDKLTMEIDQIESEYENDNEIDTSAINPDQEPEIIKQEEELEEPPKKEAQFQIAGTDISIIELQLEQPLDKFDPQSLLQKCLKMTIPTCIYCNHARKIAVNGRQLGLHCIAEHRFSAVVNSITAEELIPENFVNRINESLNELSSVFFNLDSSVSNEAVTFSHQFECFQCHFSTTVHKELYLHNRKYHSKNLLLCIMCKSNFYSYSELICHLCPGVYVLDYELQFRCCMCVHDDLPSSFRLMVHLRKKHNVCDVCLETCDTQHRLSNHVWKHKLHHFCYRCGIAYRNKPDITRHLFWKHGTESVLCKKCLQKKWPHVYHFCVPPISFVCDECSLMFTRAVSLKVHKRLHSDEKKHACTFEECEEKFISKKLLEKHYKRHLEPVEEPTIEEPETKFEEVKKEREENDPEPVKQEEKVEEKPKQKIDVLEDLPALNLSESDSSSESETEETKKLKDGSEKSKDSCLNPETELERPGDLPPMDILQELKSAGEVPGEDGTNAVMQNIWDNFKTYQEQQQKLDNMFVDQDRPDGSNMQVPQVEEEPNVNVILQDHDYCVNPEQKAIDTTLVEVKPALQESVDHDYCFSKPKDEEEEKPSTELPADIVKNNKKEEKKVRTSSSSSSDSNSSSCSCGSNCSCSSSSGSSSSSSSSSSDSSSEEGKKRQLAKKQKRKERAKKIKEAQEKKNKVDVVTTADPVVIETPIRESDLETTESETDEEFYDEAPQKLAKKILEEKRQQLLELMGPNSIPNGTFIESTSRPPTPPVEVEQPEERKKKKSKSKKKKKKKSERKTLDVREPEVNNIITPDIPIPPYYQQFHQQQQIQPQSVAPITLTISRNSPISSPASISAPLVTSAYHKVQTEPTFSRQDSIESNLRASKRRRVPNKFYGYSSDEDQDRPGPKWKKTEAPQPPRSPQVVPPITIKTQPPPTPPPPVQPPIEPISIRTGTHLSDFRVARRRPKPSIPPIRLLSRGPGDGDSASDSNDSSSEEPSITPKHAQPQLYCYCQCPYDEVSEMIGCDASDCAIEWFHFECVGIMVPPKGQWFCPDCRKKKARREIIQSMKSQSLNG